MTIGPKQRIRKPHMQTSAGRVVLRALVVLSLSFLIESSSLRAQRPASIPEEIDPRLSHQIATFAATQRVSFAVIHFNNGMHGWGYTEAQFQSGFPKFLRAIRSLPGRGKLIWATITPVNGEASGGATNPRIDARNAVAHAFIEAEKILVDDQHGLMIRHLDLYEDAVHFNENGSAIMGGQAATIIKRALETSGHE
jgi:lysophospholipase L1-like esterase